MTEPRGHRLQSDIRPSVNPSPLAHETYYRTLLETVSHGIIEIDTSGTLTFCNRAYCQIFGCTAEELIGRPVWDRQIPGPQRDALPEYFATLVADQPSPTPYFAEGLTLDGRPIDVQVDWDYRRDAQGRVIGFICGVTDVTEQRQAEQTLRRVQEELELRVRERTADLARTIAKLQAEIRERMHMEQALRESELRFDLAVRGSTDGLWDTWNPPHGSLWWSPRCFELLGYEDQAFEITSERVLELTHPDDRERLLEALRAHLEQRSSHDVECRLRTKSGEYRWFRSRGHAIWDEHGQPVRMAGSLQDITPRKQAEEALRQQSRHLDAFFEHNLTPIAFLDRQFNILRVNTAYARACQREVEELPGLNHFDLYPSEENRTIFTEVVRTKKSFQVMAKPFVYPDHAEWGVTYWDWSLVPLFDNEGEVDLLVFSLRDVTQRKRSELELQALNESLRQQTVQLRRMAAELTLAEQRERRRLAQSLHDHLQQMLVAARLKVSLLHRRILDADLSLSVQQVDELLERSIEESRSLTVELSPPVLYEDGLVAALEWLARQMEAKHALHVDVAVCADCAPITEDVRVILFQAVRELLFNVVKHAQTSLAQLQFSSDSDGLIQIVVADTGCGFHPSRLQSPTATTGGFGLFSIRERLELMGGRMEITSAPGQGARVLLAVPRRQPTPSRSDQASKAAVAKSPVESQSQDYRAIRGGNASIRVLLVDDHRIFREGLVSLLVEEADIEIVGQAADGQEALELARELHPDVILMDITMPRLDGIGATRQITSELPHICVIGLSMHDDDLGDAIRAAGARGYLSKHGPSEELLDTIRGCRARD